VTEPPFELLGLDHLLLHVRGLAEAEHFYCGVLGCAVLNRMRQHAMIELSAGVVLVDTSDPNGSWALTGSAAGRNVDHFALLTNGWEEDEMRAWLAKHSIGIEEERADDDEHSLYVRDPSGNLVELLKRT
jgi:glyoxylase I family protein